MKVSENKGGDFVPHEEGSFRGVCVDVTPLQKVTSQFGDREVFRIVFETDAPDRPEGGRQCVWSAGFTPTLNKKANLRKFLRQWFGRELTAEELEDFDTESLIGMPASLVIVHAEGNEDKRYANIAACTPCKKNPLEPSGDFIRKKDRENKSDANEEKPGYRKAAAPAKGVKEEKAEPVDETKAGAAWDQVKVHVGTHKGVELRELDQVAIEKLINNWLPKHKANTKPTADDKRLSAALKEAVKVLAEAAAEEEEDF